MSETPQGGAAAALKRPAAVEAKAADPDVERLLREGAEAYASGRLEDAHQKLGTAHRRRASDPRCLSWYGLTLIRVEKNNNLGVRYCEEAVRGPGGDDPLCWLNLARACLALGYRDRALKALTRGLEIAPEDARLREEIDLFGRRRRPVLGFLDRRNPINRLLGRWRHRLRGPPDVGK